MPHRSSSQSQRKDVEARLPPMSPGSERSWRSSSISCRSSPMPQRSQHRYYHQPIEPMPQRGFPTERSIPLSPLSQAGQVSSIPGYAGHIPSKIAENVMGRTFQEDNETARSLAGRRQSSRPTSLQSRTLYSKMHPPGLVDHLGNDLGHLGPMFNTGQPSLHAAYSKMHPPALVDHLGNQFGQLAPVQNSGPTSAHPSYMQYRMYNPTGPPALIDHLGNHHGQLGPSR
eukprot:gnl/MRDRNA2_/MRDRNA2_112715_c0_seq1.p1 gnl/MRDRNA2_/MRDRNA2_112715_c0~~gnl/MRDRNA2_/MRDRNA2_112715_c0_seq1.p1  ORF type:complete len:228 (-),score=14.59 gnl/MRDRNA2_/MRDRNA2_112715_c0_seq1:77-760(-)